MSSLLLALPIVLAQVVPPPAAAPPPTWQPPQPPLQAQPPQQAQSPQQAQPPPQQADYALPMNPADDDVVDWFVRMDIGVGTRGLSGNSALLSELGYSSAKMWMTIDGAWMFSERVGAGLWMGLNRRFADDDDGLKRGLNVVSYFVAAQLPLLLAGNRYWAFHATPRVGYATGTITLSDFGGDTSAEFQHTGAFGGALSFQSFYAHLGASIALMHMPTGAPGPLGRDMDYGGFYFSFSGTIDG
jgi:hypothetical protein